MRFLNCFRSICLKWLESRVSVLMWLYRLQTSVMKFGAFDRAFAISVPLTWLFPQLSPQVESPSFPLLSRTGYLKSPRNRHPVFLILKSFPIFLDWIALSFEPVASLISSSLRLTTRNQFWYLNSLSGVAGGILNCRPFKVSKQPEQFWIDLIAGGCC